MSSNFGQFRLDLREAMKVVPEQVISPFVRKVALQVLSGTVLATPVDTGRARGGWQVDINRTNETDTGKIDKSGFSTTAVGDVRISAYRVGDTINIFNNVKYIGVLERGRHIDEKGVTRGSLQATQGMLGLTVANVQRQFVGVAS